MSFGQSTTDSRIPNSSGGKWGREQASINNRFSRDIGTNFSNSRHGVGVGSRFQHAISEAATRTPYATTTNTRNNRTMSTRLILAPSHPPLPEQIVCLSVEVDKTTCQTDPTIDEKLSCYEREGISVPISEIVVHAGIHYEGEAQDYWGIGRECAQIQSAWQDICNWEPRSETDAKGVSRLVFTKRENSRRQANFSEVIAVGAGLVVGVRFFNRSYRFWRPTPGLSTYDFWAPGPEGSELQLEVRGRFAGDNIGTAKAQVRKKFGETATLSRQLGVIFAPRVDVNTPNVDIVLVDPEKDGLPAMDSHREFRALLLHYIPFFARQNFTEFANRLKKLAESSNNEFAAYVASGDDVLRNARVKRTTFQFEGAEFVGTAWEGLAWPTALAPRIEEIDFSKGFFYWGIWTAVLESLREGQLGDLVDMNVTVGTYVHEHRIYVLLDDATALAWVPTMNDLLDMP